MVLLVFFMCMSREEKKISENLAFIAFLDTDIIALIELFLVCNTHLIMVPDLSNYYIKW